MWGLEAGVAKGEVFISIGFGDFVGFANETGGGFHIGFEGSADCHGLW